jgi:6-phosphogluconolactonase (cycloisomerase 2 family)
MPSWHRELGLDPGATPEFTHTPGQIAFSPDGRHLAVTTKANTNAVDIFATKASGELTGGAAVTVLAGTVPFAVFFTSADRLALAEAGTSAVATFALRPDGTLRALASASTGQAATCWLTGIGNSVWASNAGSANLSGYRIAEDGTLAANGTTSTDKGTVDAAVSGNGRYLYVQTGAAGIIDEYGIGADGALTAIGSVTVANSIGAEGIAAT